VNTEVPAILKDAPEKAVIIEDKNGDQWVVQKGGQVTKVEGGGLQPGVTTPVTEGSIDIVKDAIRSLRREYDDTKISALQQEMASQMETLDKHIKAQQQEYATQATDDDETETVWSNLELSDELPAVPSSNFDQLSRAFKDSELIYNRAIVVKWLANDLNNRKAYEKVAQGLSVNGQNAEDYIQSQKTQGKTNDQIVVAVKQAIIDYITVVLSENLYQKL
jgi:hypothetical protein